MGIILTSNLHRMSKFANVSNTDLTICMIRDELIPPRTEPILTLTRFVTNKYLQQPFSSTNSYEKIFQQSKLITTDGITDQVVHEIQSNSVGRHFSDASPTENIAADKPQPTVFAACDPAWNAQFKNILNAMLGHDDVVDLYRYLKVTRIDELVNITAAALGVAKDLIVTTDPLCLGYALWRAYL